MPEVAGTGSVGAAPTLAPAGNPLSHKIQHLLQLSLEDASLLEALHTLDQVVLVGTKPEGQLLGTEARRALPSRVEHSVLQHNASFLQACGEVDTLLTQYQGQLEQFATAAHTLERQVGQLTQEAAIFLDATHDIYARRDELIAQRARMEGFLQRFTLSEGVVEVLTSPAAPIDESFFRALEQVAQMQADSRATEAIRLGIPGEDGEEEDAAGAALLRSIHHHQEQGYERLCKWAQLECRSLTQDYAEVPVLLRRGMSLLQHRPVYLHLCLQEVEHVRRTTNARAFLAALTVGGPNGFPRPIEINAHDPLRYVGDMLAWVHQTCVSEREVLESLFGLHHRQREAASATTATWAQELLPNEAALLTTLDHSMEAVGRPLQLRMHQVLGPLQDPVLCMQLQHLVTFYRTTISGILPPEAGICRLLQELSAAAGACVLDALNAEAGRLLRGFEVRAVRQRDLVPPPEVKEAMSMLATLARLLPAPAPGADTAPGHSAVGATAAEVEGSPLTMARIIPYVVDPLLQGMALVSSKMPLLDATIFQVNCLEMMLAGEYLRDLAPDGPHVADLRAQVDDVVVVLVGEQYRSILEHAGITALLHALPPPTGVPDGDTLLTPLSTLPGLEPAAVTGMLSELDVFLCSVTIDISASLQRISSTRIARRVAREGFQRFLAAYERLHAALLDPVHGYGAAQHSLLRSVEQVSLLLLSEEDAEEVAMPSLAGSTTAT